jgi:hypothetical protein
MPNISIGGSVLPKRHEASARMLDTGAAGNESRSDGGSEKRMT